MIREILTSLFRRILLDAARLTWHDATVPRLAQAIYNDHDLPSGHLKYMLILADAREDAGCDNQDILSHCRGAGPHVRGCWVVDLLLGKG